MNGWLIDKKAVRRAALAQAHARRYYYRDADRVSAKFLARFNAMVVNLLEREVGSLPSCGGGRTIK